MNLGDMQPDQIEEIERGVHYKYIFNVLLFKLDTWYVVDGYPMWIEHEQSSNNIQILLSGNDQRLTGWQGRAQKWTHERSWG